MGLIEKDVVIVGAGATGLSLALQLGRLGVSVWPSTGGRRRAIIRELAASTSVPPS
jgi:glycine/D-amino acid oxidase-like deaminating enzyme